MELTGQCLNGLINSICENSCFFLREFKKVCLLRSHSKIHFDDDDVDDELPFEHHCYDCCEDVQSKARFRHHQWRLHGYRNPFSLRVAGSFCRFCRFEFHNRARLIKTLGRTDKCADMALELPHLPDFFFNPS